MKTQICENLKFTAYLLSLPKAYLEPSQTSVMKLFEKIINGYTTQKMKFFIKDFFSICDQIRGFLRIWSHLLKKSLMEN